VKVLLIISVDFDRIDQLLIKYSTYVWLEKNGSTVGQYFICL